MIEVRASPKTKLVVLTSETLNNSKSHVKVKEGRIIIEPPKEDIEAKMRRTIIFRCQNEISRWIENPALNEVQPLFENWMGEVEFCTIGQQFSTLEFLYCDDETAYVVSTNMVESETLISNPIYMKRRTVEIRVGAVSSEIKPEWLVASTLAKEEEKIKFFIRT